MVDCNDNLSQSTLSSVNESQCMNRRKKYFEFNCMQKFGIDMEPQEKTEDYQIQNQEDEFMSKEGDEEKGGEDEYDFSVNNSLLARETQQKFGEFRKNYRNNYNDRNQRLAEKLSDMISHSEDNTTPEVVVDLTPYQHLVSEFAEANIDLILVSRPTEFSSWRATADKTTTNFLMDIRARTPGSNSNINQYIIMYPGQDSRINVSSVNKEYQQVILTISEPQRTMKVERTVYNQKTKKYITKVTHLTNVAEERTFLIGYDDSHLFISRIKENVSTVQQAHKALKPQKLKKKKKGDYKRQGEWFFVPINFELHISPLVEVRSRRLSIGTGRPHTAEYYVQVGGVDYVKGNITHPDHKTVHLGDWHTYYANNEFREARRGVAWVD